MAGADTIIIDFGTTMYRVLSKEGRHYEEPVYLPCRAETGSLYALDKDKANTYILAAERQLYALSDKDLAGIFRRLIQSVQKPKVIWRPYVFVILRDNTDAWAKKRILRAVSAAGAYKAGVLPSSEMVAALLAHNNIPLFLLLDMGAHSADLILRMPQKILKIKSLPYGGKRFDQALVQGIWGKYELIIDEAQGESLKKRYHHDPNQDGQLFMVHGRSANFGEKRRISFPEDDMKEIFAPLVDEMAEMIVRFLKDLPEVQKKVLSAQGLWLVGGGGQISGFADALRDRIGMKVRLLPEAENYAIYGAKKYFK